MTTLNKVESGTGFPDENRRLQFVDNLVRAVEIGVIETPTQVLEYFDDYMTDRAIVLASVMAKLDQIATQDPRYKSTLAYTRMLVGATLAFVQGATIR